MDRVPGISLPLGPACILELLRGAVLLGVDRAARAELRRGELAERLEVAAALVVLTLLVGGVEVPAGEGDANR